MDRLFLDANVLFSAAYRSKSRLSLFWELKQVALVSSPYAIEEAQRNLNDEHQRSRLNRLIRSIEQVRAVTSQPLAADLPAKDQPILRAALAGHPSHLITGDLRHFGKFLGKNVMGILILTPAQYLGSR